MRTGKEEYRLHPKDCYHARGLLNHEFLHVEKLAAVPVSELEVEIVERKGVGHPDTLIDGACETVSLALCDYYDREFGTIFHHNRP